MQATLTIEGLSEENKILRGEVAYLKEQLKWFERQFFGPRSEKTVSHLDENQPVLFQLPLEPAQEKIKVSACERRKSNKNSKDKIELPTDLPVERQIIDLSEEEKVCSETGLPLIKIGEEISRKIANRPGSYFIKEVVRYKYALPQNSQGGIRTPELPESLLTRCLADESFLAEILVMKFADHLPLHRISEILGRQKIHISRQVLSNWVVRAGHALEPLYDEMKRQVLESGNVFVDETPIDMLDPGRGRTHQAYMWTIVGGKESNPACRIYNFRTSRQHIHAAELLKNFEGVIHSDKYGAYESLAKTKKITWCPCWAHIRRKFLEESGDPNFRRWVLRKIRYLFMLEKVAWARSPDERLRIRKIKEIPIIDELIKAIKDRVINGPIMPKSKFKEALGYFLSLVPYLRNYTLDPWSRLDNNVAERAIRPLAVGRKNWLFVGSEEGGKAAAIILSLIQTCRNIKVNPREYLEDVMKRLMTHSSQRLSELLPHNWKKQS